jgi:hypothetical protein
MSEDRLQLVDFSQLEPSKVLKGQLFILECLAST